MNPPQPGIFALGTRAHHHLEFDVVDDDALLDHVRSVREAFGTVRGVNIVTGFEPSLWNRLRPGDGPADAADFDTMVGEHHSYPGSQHGLWVWLHGPDADAVFDAARMVAADLASVANLATVCRGFAYGASQDLTGFEDGTENPPLDDAIALLGESPIVLVQRWVHDLDRFEGLTATEQEAIIGRTLHGSVELDNPPPRAHIERVVIEDDDGEELEIFRRSVAYGDVDEAGLLFVGFAPDRGRLDHMLERMLGAGDGVADALNDISTAVSGAYYIVPAPVAFGPGSSP